MARLYGMLATAIALAASIPAPPPAFAAATNFGTYSSGPLKVSLNGWVVVGQVPDGSVGLFQEPIRTMSNGYVRIWERWEYASPMTDEQPPYRSDLQLVEIDCKQGRMRGLQRNTFSANGVEGQPGWSFSGVGDWQFVPPGTLAQDMEEIACASTAERQAIVVDFMQVQGAVSAFQSTLKDAGMIGAEQWSQDCYAQLARRPNWSELDECAAFDDTASIVDAGMSQLLKGPTISRFRPTQIATRQRAIEERLTGTPEHKREHEAEVLGAVRAELNAWSSSVSAQ